MPVTATEAAVQKLKRDIMSGALAPDLQLKMRELKLRYGIGASPMREALAQLAAEGFVHQRSQKGFRVPPVSTAELLDITRTRQRVEAEAIALAIKHADATWEEEIVASFHVLENAIRRTKAGTEDQEFFEERHHRFHRALISACPLVALRQFCDDLYVRKTRYRRLLSAYGFTSKEVIAEHRVLMEVVLARDVPGAKKAIQAHIGITADVILEVLRVKETAQTAPERKVGRRAAAIS